MNIIIDMYGWSRHRFNTDETHLQQLKDLLPSFENNLHLEECSYALGRFQPKYFEEKGKACVITCYPEDFDKVIWELTCDCKLNKDFHFITIHAVNSDIANIALTLVVGDL